MSARIPPGFAEVWVQFNTPLDPEPMYSAFGIDLASGVPMDQSEATSILGWASLSIAPTIASDYTVGPGHVIAGQDGGDVRYDGVTAPSAGTNGGNACPNNTSWLVRKVTASGGRRGRGRMYWPGVPEGDVGSTGILTSGALADLQTQASLLQSNLVALTSVDALVLFHESAPFTPTPITTLQAQTRAATQRRRMRP